MVSVGSLANKYMMFTFGDWANDFASILCSKKATRGLIRQEGSIFSNVSEAYKRAQKSSMRKAGVRNLEETSYWKFAKGSLKSWKSEVSVAAKSGLWAGTKGFFKGAGKRLPVVGTALALLTEIPNLYRAFTHKDGGVVTGTVETAKAGAKLTTMAGGAAAGAAIGTMIFPGAGTIIGSIVGGIAASFGADKIFGKSFTEKEEEKAAEGQVAQQGAPADATAVAANSSNNAAIIDAVIANNGSGVSTPGLNPKFGTLATSLPQGMTSSLSQEQQAEYAKIAAQYAAYTRN